MCGQYTWSTQLISSNGFWDLNLNVKISPFLKPEWPICKECGSPYFIIIVHLFSGMYIHMKCCILTLWYPQEQSTRLLVIRFHHVFFLWTLQHFIRLYNSAMLASDEPIFHANGHPREFSAGGVLPKCWVYSSLAQAFRRDLHSPKPNLVLGISVRYLCVIRKQVIRKSNP